MSCRQGALIALVRTDWGCCSAFDLVAYDMQQDRIFRIGLADILHRHDSRFEKEGGWDGMWLPYLANNSSTTTFASGSE